MREIEREREEREADARQTQRLQHIDSRRETVTTALTNPYFMGIITIRTHAHDIYIPIFEHDNKEFDRITPSQCKFEETRTCRTGSRH